MCYFDKNKSKQKRLYMQFTNYKIKLASLNNTNDSVNYAFKEIGSDRN